MGNTFKCFYCFEYFESILCLLDHTSEHKIPEDEELIEKYFYKGKRAILADISKLSCRICKNDTIYPNLESVKEHLITDHELNFSAGTTGMIEFHLYEEEDMYKCLICLEEFYDFPELHKHSYSHFQRNICETCGEGFVSQHLYSLHKETHKKATIKCQFCDRIFHKSTQLSYHIRAFHKGLNRAKKVQCPFCPMPFKEDESKVEHLKEAHGITKDFPCLICKAQFDKRRDLTDHVAVEHSQIFKCKECDKCFAGSSRLKIHMVSVHSREKNYVCKICKRAYMYQKSLNFHMKNHSSTYKIVCASCGEGFVHKGDYNKHMKLWHFFGEANKYEEKKDLFFQLQ